MKMYETKPGDIIKFNMGNDIICIVTEKPLDHYVGDKKDWPKLIILWESNNYNVAGEWYDQYQYDAVFNNYDVTLLKLGIKE